jgi:hypothetical protein
VGLVTIFARSVTFSFLLALLTAQVLVLPLGNIAFAKGGAIDSGGGVVVVCKEGRDEKVYLADIFKESRIKRFGTSAKDTTSNLDSAFASFVKVIDRIHPDKVFATPEGADVTLGGILAYKRSKLSFVDGGELELLNDDHISELPEGCHKEQLAIQEISTGVVRVNKRLLAGLGYVEQAFFQLHEALIAWRAAPGESTASIRGQVESVLNEQISFEALVREIRLGKFADLISCDIDRAASRPPMIEDKWNRGRLIPVNAVRVETGRGLPLDFFGPSTAPGFPGPENSADKSGFIAHVKGGMVQSLEGRDGGLTRVVIRWPAAAVVIDMESRTGALLSPEDKVKPVKLKNCSFDRYASPADTVLGWGAVYPH